MQVDNAKLSAFAEQASTDILQVSERDALPWCMTQFQKHLCSRT